MENVEEPPTQIKIKARKKGQKSFRSKEKVKEEEDHEESGVDIDSVKQKIKQRAESRPTKTNTNIEKKEKVFEAPAEEGSLIWKQERMKAGLNAFFTAQKEGDIEQTMMKEYIESKIEEKRKKEELERIYAARAQELAFQLQNSGEKRKLENQSDEQNKKKKEEQ
eukprot:TRINITY_DN2370_c0_g1_i1.p1 TRINITY_DN2370_c0_g1~~TRINITY_DN2370_c0_g1_i1.p1  ORF type:complete len:165 (-),score=63.17 TRINITY_DN2370_c0_g1_i1:154-648(-)